MDNNNRGFRRSTETFSSIDRGSFAIIEIQVPDGYDSRALMMRSALATAIAALSGNPIASFAQVPAPPPPLSPNLNVVQQSKGPVLTRVDEFYTVGPGPSST